MKKATLSALFVALMLALAPALAVRTNVNLLTLVDPQGTVSAGAADLAWTAADVSNGNSFVMSGKEMIFVTNSDSVSHNVTISSAPDVLGRTKDIGPYAVGAGKVSVFGPFNTHGWRQSDRSFYLAGDNAQIKFAIVRLP